MVAPDRRKTRFNPAKYDRCKGLPMNPDSTTLRYCDSYAVPKTDPEHDALSKAEEPVIQINVKFR
jgi:hypothetical protein